jgi:hypothetical protein
MMENMEKWIGVETEIPESFLEKIKAICELREIDTETWIREAIAYNLADDVSHLTGDEYELVLEDLEDAIKKNKVEGGNVE